MSLRSLTRRFMEGVSSENDDWKNDQDFDSFTVRAKECKVLKLFESRTSTNCTDEASIISRPMRLTSGELFSPGIIFLKASVISAFSPRAFIGFH